MKLLDKMFPPNQWEMDPNHKVEWQTDYGSNDFAKGVEDALNKFGRKINIFFRTAELVNVSVGTFIKQKLGLKTNKAYLAKLSMMLDNEFDAYLLDTEVNKELKEEYQNVKFLGSSRYNPLYNHEAYIAEAKKRSITG